MNKAQIEFFEKLKELVVEYDVQCIRPFNHDNHSTNNVLVFGNGAEIVFPRKVTIDDFINYIQNPYFMIKKNKL